MSIYRTNKRENYFVQIDRRSLDDDKLSWKAKGILCYMLSMPNDWIFYESELLKHSTDGKDSFRTGIRELIECGYMERNQIRNEKGQFKTKEIVVYEYPPKKTETGLTENGFSDLGESDTTNNDLTNTDLKKSDLSPMENENKSIPAEFKDNPIQPPPAERPQSDFPRKTIDINQMNKGNVSFESMFAYFLTYEERNNFEKLNLYDKDLIQRISLDIMTDSKLDNSKKIEFHEALLNTLNSNGDFDKPTKAELNYKLSKRLNHLCLE